MIISLLLHSIHLRSPISVAGLHIEEKPPMNTNLSDSSSRYAGAGYFLILILALLFTASTLLAGRLDESDGFINFRINQDSTEELQNEQQIVVNPLDPDNIVAVWRDFRKGYRQVGYGWTKDGGRTWTEDLFVDQDYPWDSDPGVTVDRFGNFYAVVLAYVSTSEENALFVYKSEDGGENWTGPFTVVDGVQNVFEDKELIACDRSGGLYDGNLYVAWARFGFSSTIYFARSIDGGITFEDELRVSDASSTQWPVPVVGPEGEVYVAWDSYSSPYRIKLDRSFDGGVTFGTDINVRNVSASPGGSINGGITVYPYPAMDVDMETGTLYMAYMDNGNSSKDIFFIKSTDKGATWSLPTRINDDPPDNGCDQFHPWLSVDEKGIISVIFLDRRNDPSNYMMDCYMTWSTDGGETFSRNIRLSTESSDPRAGSLGDIASGYSATAPAGRCMPLSGSRAGLLGEYIGLSTRNGVRAAPIWTDTRNGHQDAFFALPDTTRFLVDFTTTTPEVAQGGVLHADYEISHLGESTLEPMGWIDVYMSDGTAFSGNPYLGPVDALFSPGQTRTGHLSHSVPSAAPAGEGYRLELSIGYWPYFVMSMQSFEFAIVEP